MFEAESQELQRCLEKDQALLKAQAQRLERMLGGPDDDEEIQEDLEDGGHSFSEVVEQLSKVS